jgi:hypothetical protein
LKISLDFLYVGILRSAKSLEIQSLFDTNWIYELVRDQQKSDSILGFEWPFIGELLVISTHSIQFYIVNAKSGKFFKVRQIRIHMNWYQYWNETNLLIVSSGSSNLFIFRIGGNCTYETLPTLKLQLPQTRTARGIEPIPVQITRLDVFTFTIYDNNYIAFLNNWFLAPTLCLYRTLTQKNYQLEYELILETQGNFSFNVIDNLLLVHNMKEEVLYY